MSDNRLILDACRRGNLTDAEVEQLRKLSPEERSELIVTLCREVAIAEANRIKSGLPPTEPEPWPESTWEWLRKWAAEARCRTKQRDSSADDVPGQTNRR